jgi:hypothetical protein
MSENSLGAIEKWFDSSPPQLVSAATGPVVSYSQLLGPLASQIGEQSEEISEQEQFARKLELFKQFPGVGTISILEFARRRSGWDASKLDKVAEQRPKFERFLSDVQAAPFFTLVLSQKTTLHHESSDWNQLIAAIATTFEGLATEDKKRVTEGITNLAMTAASSESFRQTEDLFAQSVLNADTNNWSIYLYRSSVTLETHKDKGATTRQTDFIIQKLKLKLLHEQWPFWAEKVLRATDARAPDDWLSGSTTPRGNLAFNLCIGQSASK